MCAVKRGVFDLHRQLLGERASLPLGSGGSPPPSSAPQPCLGREAVPDEGLRASWTRIAPQPGKAGGRGGLLTGRPSRLGGSAKARRSDCDSAVTTSENSRRKETRRGCGREYGLRSSADTRTPHAGRAGPGRGGLLLLSSRFHLPSGPPSCPCGLRPWWWNASASSHLLSSSCLRERR